MTAIFSQYQQWVSKGLEDPAIQQELREIANDSEAISERFYRHLEFGTGGLRGIMGAGTNRINLYTIRRATQGLAAYLKEQHQNTSICIAYDTRLRSQDFAHAAAEVLCGNGITVHLFEGARPTPMLSFAVRHLQCDAGIVITASHNPKEYNGYKVYGNDGGQITDSAAAQILEKIEGCEFFEDILTMPIEQAIVQGRLFLLGQELDTAYYECVSGLVMRRRLLQEKAEQLSILYTPLNGSGNIPVREALSRLGFTQLAVVPEQEQPDGTFPTMPTPNPEDPAVFLLALAQAQDQHPDIIFATDPDCDRIGVLAKRGQGDYAMLTGNQVGLLLCHYILKTQSLLGLLPKEPVVVKTIVTSDLAQKICQQYGVELCEVLTGFKYIGEKIRQWEETGEKQFLFGFEESCGYLMGSFVRDKDAIQAAVLVSEMALYYKQKGITLFQALDKLYQQYGYCTEKLISITLPGQKGQEKIKTLFSSIRANYPQLLAGQKLKAFEDYQQRVRIDYMTGRCQSLRLPQSEVFKFLFQDDSWVVLRPSKTEPKMKVYLLAWGTNGDAARQRLAQLQELAHNMLTIQSECRAGSEP